MYSVLRRYRVRLGTVAQAATHAKETLLPLLKQVPGFEAYYMLDTGNNVVAALSLFQTREAADAATNVLSDWFRSDWPAFRLMPPELSVSELLTAEASWRDAGTVPDQRMGTDRRIGHERRMMTERRASVAAIVAERRRGAHRRTGLDRRSGLERRVDRTATRSVPAPPHRGIAPAWRRREPSRTA